MLTTLGLMDGMKKLLLFYGKQFCQNTLKGSILLRSRPLFSGVQEKLEGLNLTVSFLYGLNTFVLNITPYFNYKPPPHTHLHEC